MSNEEIQRLAWEMGPLPTEHPRERIMRSASVDFDNLLHQLVLTHDLTSTEMAAIVLGRLQQRLYRLISKERAT